MKFIYIAIAIVFASFGKPADTVEQENPNWQNIHAGIWKTTVGQPGKVNL